MSGIHRNIPVGAESAHPLGYNQSSDPGAVGAYKPWIDTTTSGSWALKIRNAANGAWETVAGGGLVSSVFGRSGAVVAASGDYTVSQVTGAAPLASPTFTGTVTVPTATAGDDSTKAASTAFVKNAVDDAVTGGGALPTGGTTGQVLTKQSGSDGDADWEDAAGGDYEAGNGGWLIQEYRYSNQATAWEATKVQVTNSGHTSAVETDRGPLSSYDHTSNGFVAGRFGTGLYLRFGRRPRLWAIIAAPSQGVTNVRKWFGFAVSDPGDLSAPNSSTVAFRFDSALDTNWQCYVSNGGGAGVNTIVDTGVAVTTGTVYTLRVEVDTAEARFYVDDVLKATITTNLPVASTTCSWWHRIQNLVGSQTRSLTAGRYEIVSRHG